MTRITSVPEDTVETLTSLSRKFGRIAKSKGGKENPSPREFESHLVGLIPNVKCHDGSNGQLTQSSTYF